MHIGAAVAHVHQPVRPDPELGPQLLQTATLPYPAGTRAMDWISPDCGSYRNRVPQMCSAGTTPSSAEMITSSGAAEIT